MHFKNGEACSGSSEGILMTSGVVPSKPVNVASVPQRAPASVLAEKQGLFHALENGYEH